MRRSILWLALELWVPALVVVLWWVLSAGSDNFYFPPLASILDRFQDLFLFDKWGSDVLPSLRNLAAALALTLIIGVPLGYLLGSVRWLRTLLDWPLNFTWSLPKLAILPAFIAVAGLGAEMKILFIFSGTLWPVLLGTIDGVRAVDPTLRDLMRSYHVRPWLRARDVYLPASSPQIIAGLRTSLAIGFVLVVAGEMVASTEGIGYFVLTSQQAFALADMWAGALLIGLLGYLLNLVFALGERRLLRWHTARREVHA